MDYKDKALRPGTVLQGATAYRIERVLGAGGFGITYLASMTMRVGNLNVKAHVAIKEHFIGDQCERAGDSHTVVCPGTDASRALVAGSLRDFVSEARRLAEYGAGHGNIVKVNEIFEINGTAYYVMEYLEGESLDAYIKRNGPLGEDEIRSLVFPVVDAVAYLHARRLTHLDIKPANIMLGADGDGNVRPVLIDFGLSKHYNADGSATSTVNTMACSDGYAPAEQYSGIRTFSPTADVYALGATILAAATGRTPTAANDWPAGEPEATIAGLGLGATMRTAIAKAMAMRKFDRYPDAGALLAALGGKEAVKTRLLTHPESEPGTTKPFPEPLSSPKPLSEIPAPTPKANRKPLLFGLVGLLVLVVAGIAVFSSKGDGLATVAPDTLAVVGEAMVAENVQAIGQQTSPTTQNTSIPDDNERLERERAEAQRLEQERLEQERIERERAEAQRLEQERLEQERIERERAEAQRLEQERIEREEAEMRTPHNLDLAIRREGRTLYLNQSNWRSRIRPGDEKLGVVIIKNGERFILALEDEAGGAFMDWHEAMRHFGNRLPTKGQGEAWLSQADAVADAGEAYGGSFPSNSLYWTRTEYENVPSYAWHVDMRYGGVSLNGKPNPIRVRAVAPVPVSSAI